MRKSLLLFAVAVIATCSNLHAQSFLKRSIIIQEFTVTLDGTTDTADFAPLVIDNTGNVTVASNKKISATQYDATTAHQLSSGVNIWVNSFSSPTNQKAYVTASCSDNSGNIFVTGAVRTSSTNGFDMFVVGYNSSGVQFLSQTYNGPYSTSDVGIGICVDNNNAVYITGASDGNLPGITDYATIAFDATSGMQLWASRYDYNFYMDVPTGIVYDPIGGVLMVTGASGTTLTDYDIATIKYSSGPFGGSQISSLRTTNTGAGFDKPFGIVTDGSGNVYIAGTIYNGNTGNYDVQVQKLDTSLTAIWTHTLDGYGGDDAGIGIALDSQNNVVVTGSTTRSTGALELFVLKYSNAGVLYRKFFDHSNALASEGMRVKIGTNDDIFIGGNIGTGVGQDVQILVLDSACKPMGHKQFNGTSNLEDKFMDMSITTDLIYLSLRSGNGTNDDNVVVTYNYSSFTYSTVVDTVSQSGYIAHNAIIGFHPAALKMTKINDRQFEYGKLHDFVADSTCDKISAALNGTDPYSRIDAKTFNTRKIVLQTDADTLSVSRLGTNVHIPPFYATLLVELPSAVSEPTAVATIATALPDITGSQLDYIYELDWVPNDTYYANQSSLHSTSTYTNAHINCEAAWIRSKGEQFVQVGIYDTGVQQTQPDIVPDQDYSYVPNTGPDDYIGHGTSVASIVGSKSNNSMGTAGIAGGDNATPGASIINMKVGDDYLLSWHDMKPAFIDGASATSVPNGKGLHIMNCSFGTHQSSDPDLLAAVNYVNKNEVALVCSRGNKYSNSTYSVNAANIPATMKPKITMNVGASGTDGHYHSIDVTPANGTIFTSMNDLNVDFVAPGAYANVYCAIVPPNTNPNASTQTLPTYSVFAGTSASAPHVSGVVALMMSYRNANYSNWDNIVHEDCEALLKRSATDLASSFYSETSGPDINTGYGRINADAALQTLDAQYKIRHIDPSHYSTSVSTTTSVAHANVSMSYNSPDPTNTVLPQNGVYNTDVIEVLKQYSYNYSSETLIDAWPLYGVSTGYIDCISPLISLNIPTDEPGNVEVVSASTTSAITRTYVYKLKTLLSTSTTVNAFVPATPGNVNSAFTLYTLGNPAVGIKSNEPLVNYFSLYPNPSNGNFTIGFSSKKECQANIVITDMMGQVVYEKEQTVAMGVNLYNLTFAGLSKGIYFLSLNLDSNKSLVKKLIIE